MKTRQRGVFGDCLRPLSRKTFSFPTEDKARARRRSAGRRSVEDHPSAYPGCREIVARGYLPIHCGQRNEVRASLDYAVEIAVHQNIASAGLGGSPVARGMLCRRVSSFGPRR